jgi:hypothetical protein
MQGRWDLIVYVLSCYYVVHGVCTPFAFLCASDAVSKVELIVAHAKLGLIADCFFFLWWTRDWTSKWMVVNESDRFRSMYTFSSYVSFQARF